jgi:Ca2+-binding EF-hand superfamily protein
MEDYVLVDTLKHSFCLFDKDGDGSISVEELHETLRSLGMPIELDELKMLVGDDEQISFQDYCALMNSPVPVDNTLVKSVSSNNRDEIFTSPENVQKAIIERNRRKARLTDGNILTRFVKRVYSWARRTLNTASFNRKRRLSLTGFQIYPNTPPGAKTKPDYSDSSFSEELLKELLLVYQYLDSNNDGVISFNEISCVISKLGLSTVLEDDEVTNLLNLIGVVPSDNPYLTFPQFVELFRQCSER